MVKTNTALPSDVAAQLMQAEIAFWLQNLKGKKFHAMLTDEAGRILDRFEHIKLRDAVDEKSQSHSTTLCSGNGNWWRHSRAVW